MVVTTLHKSLEEVRNIPDSDLLLIAAYEQWKAEKIKEMQDGSR